jgi:hypothetical protein
MQAEENSAECAEAKCGHDQLIAPNLRVTQEHYFYRTHVLCRAVIERLLHDRLLGARGATESALQCRITSQPRVDLAQTMRAAEDRHKRIRHTSLSACA